MDFRHQGVTLIELLVTIAVLVIALGIAVPAFTNFIQSNRVTGSANGLVSALAFARSEAVARAETVRLCPANTDFDACAGSDWSAGWLALVASGDDNGEILRAWDGPPARLQVSTNVQGASADQVDFLALGDVEVSGSPFVFAWTMRPDNCSSGRPFQRRVDVSRSGRAQVLREDCP